MPEIPTGYADFFNSLAHFLFVIWLFWMSSPIGDWLRRVPKAEPDTPPRRLLEFLRRRD